MKHSASLTSLSSMDKADLYLSYISQHGRSTAPDILSAPKRSSSKASNESRFYENSSRQLQHIDEAMPNLLHKKRRKRHGQLTANLSGTRYEVVRHTVEKLGFTAITEDDPTSNLIWNDSFVSPDRISELKQYQHVNHFPGMGEVTRKDALARNFAKMQKAMPEEYNFIPRTWILPADYSLLQNYAKDMKQRKKNVTFIVKPSNGAQGHGISLFKNAEKIPSSEHYIVQEYIDKPLLLDGFKFDLRIYVLITSCDPLRIFLFSDGLVRLATEKYLSPHENNLNHLFMHLTNYSLNKHNEFYDKNMAFDTGSKRSIRYFNEYLRRSDIDVGLLWRNIADMIVRTLLVAQPHVLHAYRMCRPGVPSGSSSVCFEILGFDIMIDRKLRPWLLEINRSPSFGTDERLDFEIKSALLEDTFRLLNIRSGDKKKNLQAQKAEAQKRLFKFNRKLDANEFTELDRKKAHNEKRKEELKELLTRVRMIASREDFESRNCGGFRRIFPSDNSEKQERYCTIMNEAFSIFLAGRAASVQREIEVNYGNKYKEDEILDLIAECEADESSARQYFGKKTLNAPKPLQSMPESLPLPPESEVMDEDSDDSKSTDLHTERRSLSSGSRSRSTSQKRMHSGGSPQGGIPRVSSNPMGLRSLSQNNERQQQQQRMSRSLSRAATASKLTAIQRSNVSTNTNNLLTKEKEDELTKKTLAMLNDMRIKFPGKSDQEADMLLEQINENWKLHKARIATYWLVKLDSVKRKKVIDIVKHNVHTTLHRIWHTPDLGSLHLSRIFGRLFNRLLWSHGQGLWNSFSSNGVWETMFCRSGESISVTELDCCRRIAQLCRDCLIIVYKFTEEAKSFTGVVGGDQIQQQQADSKHQVLSNHGYVATSDLKPPSGWGPHSATNQRYTRYYHHPGFSNSS